MADKSPVVRFAELSDLPGLVRLFATYYSQDKPESYFRWQFFSPEMLAKLVVALDGDEVVGSFGLMSRPLSHGRRCAQAMDMLLDESHRGQGLFQKMVHHACQAYPDIDYLVVLANRAGMDAVTRSLGWFVVAQVPLYTAPQVPGNGTGGSLSPIDDVVSNDALRIMYDQGALWWRFDMHPIYQYHVLNVAGVRGYLKIFTSPNNESCRTGDIMYVASATQEATERWLCQAFEWFRQNAVQSCGLWALPDTVMARSAMRVGLVPEYQERWLCTASLEKGEAGGFCAENWDICQADVEFY